MLSQKTRYTIRALQHLADRYRQGPVPLTDIATRQNIPAKFLTVILSELSREGLVATQRGRDGGYWLALAPVDISYGDIVRLTRGSLALTPCASRSNTENSRSDSSACSGRASVRPTSKTMRSASSGSM